MQSLSKEPFEETMEGDLYVIPRLQHRSERLQYAFSSFSLPHYGWLYRQLLIRSMDDVKSLCMGEYTTVNKYQMRGYVPFEADEEYKEIKKTPQEVYHKSKISTVRYDRNIEYLEKAIELCREHGAEVILVGMPMSEYSISKYRNLQKIHDYYQLIADRYGISYLDFNLWKYKTDYLSDDKYQNPTHMGNELAPVFSEQFARIMKDYFAEDDISGYFYPDFKTLCRERGYAAE